MKLPVILRVYRNSQLKEVKQFSIDQIVIGSNTDAQLNLSGDEISPIHCLIENRDNGYYICDLGSKTGTFKNGQAILDEPVGSGDEILIGPYKIVFFVGIPKPSGAPKDTGVTRESSVVRDSSIVKSVSESSPQTTPQITSQATLQTLAPTSVTSSVVDDDKTQDVSKVPDISNIPKDTGSIKNINAVKKPEIIDHSTKKSTRKKKKFSFAPGDEIKNLKTYLSPTKGAVVEVNLAWDQRIIHTYHFYKKSLVRVGVDNENSVNIPSSLFPMHWTLLDLTSGLRVNLPSGLQVELISSKATFKEDVLLATQKASPTANGLQVRVESGEMLVVELPDKKLSLFIRLVENMGFVPFAPLLLSSSEMGSIIIAFIISGMLAFYVATMTSKFQPPVDENKTTYTAQVIFNEVKKEEKIIPPPPPPPPVTPPPKAEVKPPPPIEKPAKIKLSDETKDISKKGNPTNTPKQVTQVARKAVEVAPIPNSQNKPKKFTSTKQGGAVKIGEKAGANAQSAVKDVNKLGLFSAFGSGGVKSKLDQAYQGAGDILGNSDRPSGGAGFGEDRPGDDLGSKFKDTGRGGKGTATEGIAGIGTKGRAGGTSLYGSTDGFGEKTSVAIQAGGNEETFNGSIDKEAVRRRIKYNINLIRGCYNQELNRLDKNGRRSLEGKVVVKWDIVSQGIAKNVRVTSSTLNNSEIEKCIAERLATIVFPDPPADTSAEVTYPFVFKNEK